MVKKSFVMAMDLRLDGKSPMMMAGEGEELWLCCGSPLPRSLNAAKERRGRATQTR